MIVKTEMAAMEAARNASIQFIILWCLVASSYVCADNKTTSGLRVGYYQSRCPKAEIIVQEAVKEAVSANPGLAAGLLRLHFHDCFVRGCDASILLNSTGSGMPVELTSEASIGLRGFKVIDDAKSRLEAECPNTVSCADIIAFAARDGAVLSQFPHYDVPSGRRDGTISNAVEILGNLPVPFSHNAMDMILVFNKKGLTAIDLVALLGAHSIGHVHCKVISSQVKSDTGSGSLLMWTAEELGIDERYAAHLRSLCPAWTLTGEETVVSLNPSPVPENRVLSNKYYYNLLHGKSPLMSDQALKLNPETLVTVMAMSDDEKYWRESFEAAMIKMGTIEVMTGDQGQIRKSCSLINR